MGFSQYLEEKLVDHTLAIAPFAMPATVYVAVLTASPGDAGTMTAERRGASGVRPSASFTRADSTGSNDADVTIVDFASEANLTHFAIMDDPAAGNMLYWNALVAPKTIPATEDARFKTGSLTVTLD
jgi:hypothetical protein